MSDPGKAVLLESLARSITRTSQPMADPEHDLLRESMHTVLIVLQAQCSNGNGPTISIRKVIAYGAAAGAFISGLVHGVKSLLP
jgi:hypothetical protein